MALKKKITKEAFEKLSDALKGEYKASGDDYILDLDDDGEDTGALKRAKDREKQRADEAEARAKELQKKLDEGSDIDARKRGDIETLEKSWNAKHETLKGEFTGKLTKLQEYAKKTLIDGTAVALASQISTVPGIMAKSIKERLHVDFDGDEPTLRILDSAGKVSALTVEELGKEFLTNKEYAPIIIASKATGGGASKVGKTTKVNRVDDETPADVTKLKPKEMVAHIQAKKEQQTE